MNIVFYHKNCTDGFGAAFAAFIKLRQDAVYIPVDYKPVQDMAPLEALEYVFKDKGIASEDYADLRVFIVDYAFPVDHYKVHRQLFKQIVILDHHKTAIESYLPYIKEERYDDSHITEEGEHGKIAYSAFRKDKNLIVFSSRKSGAMLSYIAFVSGKVPMLFELISDRDLWTFKYGDQARALHLYLESIKPWSFEQWRPLLEEQFLTEKIAIGMVLLQERNALLASYADQAVPITIPVGDVLYKGMAVQAPAHLASGVGEQIYNAGYDYAVIYNLTEYGYGCSLRSTGDFSVEAIAKHYGGGGHLNAAGCTISKDLFEKFLLCSE